MDLKILAVVFMFSIVAAGTVLDTDLGYVDVNGLSVQGDHFVLNGSTLEITAASTANFVAKSYTVSVKPKNLERIAKDLGIPLSDNFNYTIPEGQVYTQTIKLPDIVCGTYSIEGELKYLIEGEEQSFSKTLKLSIPCKDFKGSLISGLVAKLPYPVLKFFAGLMGVRFG